MKKIFLFVLLCLAAYISQAQKTNSAGLHGKWVFVSSTEKDLGIIHENNLPNLVFDYVEKSVSGSTGCNTIKGSFNVEGDQLTFGPMISTKKACTDMQVENHINQLLTTVTSYKVDSNKLFLYSADKAKYLVYRK
ncbi:MAG: META domain-containing protein [Chitinophagaceae bacterium]